MSLTDKRCTPCQGGIPPLSREDAEARMPEIPGWSLSDDARVLTRRFKTPNFAEAQAVANKAGDVAEDQDHHPEIRFGYGYCEVEIYTHAINGLHENDFIYAAHVNAAVDG